jgi:diguanylate cyclase (GGDEF)-like protein
MSRQTLYAAIGAALSLGAPLGLLLLRAARSGELSLGWLRRELQADRAGYVYVCLSTLVAFTLFGWVLGRNADRLVELSTSDPLTGLNNRRALFERIRHELTRAARYDEPLSLLLIDVDRLKDLNDRQGHRAGDAALRLVGSAVRGGSRASDLAARWGGDEFALLAPNTGLDAAARLAERVRALVAASQPSAGARVTISVGVSTLAAKPRLQEPETLIATADAALYEAKRSGRDRVVSRLWATDSAPPASS